MEAKNVIFNVMEKLKRNLTSNFRFIGLLIKKILQNVFLHKVKKKNLAYLSLPFYVIHKIVIINVYIFYSIL